MHGLSKQNFPTARWCYHIGGDKNRPVGLSGLQSPNHDVNLAGILGTQGRIEKPWLGVTVGKGTSITEERVWGGG